MLANHEPCHDTARPTARSMVTALGGLVGATITSAALLDAAGSDWRSRERGPRARGPLTFPAPTGSSRLPAARHRSRPGSSGVSCCSAPPQVEKLNPRDVLADNRVARRAAAERVT